MDGGAAVTTLVYDGDCAFCSSSVRAMHRLGLRPDVVIAWQQADLGSLGLTRAMCDDKVQWVSQGRVSSGHEAIAQLLMSSGRAWWVPGRLLLVPGLSWLAAAVYRWVSAHRHQLPGGTPACQVMGDSRPPPT